MKKGKYYYCWDTYTDANFFMIGLSNMKPLESDPNRCDVKYLLSNEDKGKFQTNTRWCYISSFRNYREATPFEIQWLKQSIKENRYVPKDQIKWKSSYEIYY